MDISNSELLAVIRQFNPWWGDSPVPDLPPKQRAALREINAWMDAPANDALLLSGARQVGKTTLFLQAIQHLLDQGVPSQNIIYLTFDHPLLRLKGIEETLRLWADFELGREGHLYIFLDEIQSVRNWEVWLKHQVDFASDRHIAVTGSAMSLGDDSAESGVGRWYTIKLATLSFYEFLFLKGELPAGLPDIGSLQNLFAMGSREFLRISEVARPLVPAFHEYLLHGGFPKTALEPSVTKSQRMLREDIVDKVLKRDMTAFFGVRNVLEMEDVFLYLCLHDGGILDMEQLARNLDGISKATARKFIDRFEAAHLVYRLMPYGYGKEVLRGRAKLYMADPSIAPSVLLLGRGLLEDKVKLGYAAEAAAVKHIISRYYRQSISFSYWRPKKGKEVDIIATMEGLETVPFEIKYQAKPINRQDVAGLIDFCIKYQPERGYILTQEITDLGPAYGIDAGETKLMRVPVPLACYWLGQSE